MNAVSHPIVTQNDSLVLTNFQGKLSETWGVGKAPQTLSWLKSLSRGVQSYEVRSITAEESHASCASGPQRPHRSVLSPLRVLSVTG